MLHTHCSYEDYQAPIIIQEGEIPGAHGTGEAVDLKLRDGP